MEEEKRPSEEKQTEKKRSFFRVHVFDFLLLGVFLIGTLTAFGFQIAQANANADASLVATVLCRNNPLEILDAQGKNRNPIELSKVTEYEEIEIQGLKTTMTIGIRHNEIAVVSSGCPGQECVHQGWIGHPNQPIVCAHNGILIDVQGEKDDIIIM